MTDISQITNNEAAHRFEVTIDGHLGELRYRRDGDRLVLTHTEVADALEGQGVGSALVRAALDHADQHDLTLVPHCPFARRWLEQHPDDAARVTIDW